MTRLPARLIAAGLVAFAACAALVALGTWQVQRRAWKLDLIAQVAARVHAVPVATPGPSEWPEIDAASAQYRRVRLVGMYLPAQTLVQASTERGTGWWVLAPMRTDRGFTVLVNRGFVAGRDAPAPPAGSQTVTGLLRISEPGGGFLRANDPANGRWYSRDVAAIAAAGHLAQVAPYFVDADAASSKPGGPIGGLTVIAFPNNHLVYALTWYMLAAMVAGGFVIFVRMQGRGAGA
ncbi:MAG: SURF1 family protein [Sphingomonas sp.]